MKKLLAIAVVLAITMTGLLVVISFLFDSKGTAPDKTSAQKHSHEPRGDNNAGSELGYHVEGALPEHGIDKISRAGEATSLESEFETERVLRIIGASESNLFEISYSAVVDTLDSSCLPVLRSMLQDNKFKNRWIHVSKIICWLSEKDDKESFDAILNYITRPDSWLEEDAIGAAGQLMGKGLALEYLGLMANSDVSSILRRAITREGAEELVESWSALPLPEPYDDRQSLITALRGHAARGLVFSRDPVNVALVREEFENLIHQYLSTSPSNVDLSNETSSEFALLSPLRDALAEDEVITEMGLQDCLRNYNSRERINLKVGHLQELYGGDVGARGLDIKQCPMCGKTRN